MKLSPDVLNALKTAEIGGDTFVTLQFPPLGSAYPGVKHALELLGGSWNRTLGTHVLHGTRDEALTRFGEALRSGQLPKRNPNAYFPTPDSLADSMAEQLLNEIGYRTVNSEYVLRILEPSAGTGALLRAVQRAAERAEIPAHQLELHAHEIDPGRAASLADQGFTVTTGDTLAVLPEGTYDGVIMNPPFATPGLPNAGQVHVQHCVRHLKPGGSLITVLPQGNGPFNETPLAQAIKDLHYEGEYLPAGTFREAGTMVGTILLAIENRTHELNRPLNGYSSVWAARVALIIASSYPLEIKHPNLTPDMPARQLLSVFRYAITACEELVNSCEITNHQRPPGYERDLLELIIRQYWPELAPEASQKLLQDLTQAALASTPPTAPGKRSSLKPAPGQALAGQPGLF